MHFLLSVIDDRSNSGTTDEMAAITAFNDRLRANGHWVYANGLGAPDTAQVIDNRGAIADVTAGPFLVSHDYLSGFWIIDAPDHERALTLATEASRCCNRRIELRPFLQGD
jgi:hypothetical protein